MPEDKEYLPSSQREEVEEVQEDMKLSGRFNDLEKKLEAIDMLSEIFKFPLGCKVRNLHAETGYIEMCAIDHRGTLYLVSMGNNERYWYSEFEIKKIPFDPENNKDHPKLDDHRVQTDFPDTKKPNEIKPETPFEVG